MATAKIRQATAASTSILAPDLPICDTTNGGAYEITLVKAGSFTPRARDVIYNLFDENMSDLSSKSSFTYTEKSKREELFDPSARYIIVRSVDASTSDLAREEEDDKRGEASTTSNPIPIPVPSVLSRSGPRPGNRTTSPLISQTSLSLLAEDMDIQPGSKGKGKGKVRRENQVDFTSEELLGYCSFRFDTEETLTPRDAEVIYCYELQLRRSARRTGLGRRLIVIMESIGKRRAMDKVMLTCLKANTTALAFYQKNGYTPDEIDPTRMAEEEEWADEDDEEDSDGGDVADYVILSKSLL